MSFSLPMGKLCQRFCRFAIVFFFFRENCFSSRVFLWFFPSVASILERTSDNHKTNARKKNNEKISAAHNNKISLFDRFLPASLSIHFVSRIKEKIKKYFKHTFITKQHTKLNMFTAFVCYMIRST